MASSVVQDLPPTPIERVLTPFLRFARLETAGGILLIVCAVVAVVIANSSWADAYHHLWDTELGVRIGALNVTTSLHHFINDGLMVVFFFLVGLEIKREALVGELASPRKAALPAAAALGGMLVPAAIYLAFNAGSPGARGWGIPMATDIAFALGVLTILGSAVPVALKVFLTALAIADDIGAVLVIALFYTDQIVWPALLLGFVILAACVLANRLGVRTPLAYMFLGIVLWVCFLASGVHATVAGVLLALTVPASTRISAEEFSTLGQAALNAFNEAGDNSTSVVSNSDQQEALYRLEQDAEAAQAPLQRIEHSLHGLVAFGIIPLFALANAGVRIESGLAASLAQPVTLGVILGLLLGKPIGIVLFSWLAVKAGLAQLPEQIGWKAMHATSWLGGIGFTMSLFVTSLAFSDNRLIDQAKVGILSASLLAGIMGWHMLRRLYPERRQTRRPKES